MGTGVGAGGASALKVLYLCGNTLSIANLSAFAGLAPTWQLIKIRTAANRSKKFSATCFQ